MPFGKVFPVKGIFGIGLIPIFPVSGVVETVPKVSAELKFVGTATSVRLFDFKVPV